MPRSRRSSTNSAAPLPRNLAGLLLTEAVRRARHDPNALAEFAFHDATGRPLRQAAIHRQLQAFLSEHPRALVELPRDHGKSMQMCVRVLWELGRDPSLRVKIACATQSLAGERGRFLRDAIAGNRRLRLVFPELRPAQSPWRPEAFAIARPAEVIGPSVAALGVGTGSTGTRADLLICDDLVDVRCLSRPGERERVAAAFYENLLNLLEPAGRCWCFFTPWHHHDLNARLKHNPAFALFRRAVGPELEPVWPERWPSERLAERRAEIGTMAFARGYRLLTLPDETTLIRPEWLRTWTIEEPAERLLLAVDPALSAKRSADATALVTLARVAGRQVHCREALARRVTAPEMVTLIDDAVERWQPECVLFESNAAFAGIRDLLVRHARFGPRIKSIVQTRDKSSRMQAFSVLMENGTFRLRGGVGGVDASQQALFEEMTTFPVGEHDDLLDAAAFGTAELLSGLEPRVWT